MVLQGGHGYAGLKGEAAGSVYQLNENGAFGIDDARHPIVGMSLEIEVDSPVRSYFNVAVPAPSNEWLAEIPKVAAVSFELDDFHLTVNGSLVYVLSNADKDGEHKAIVLRGGHGVEAFLGTKPGETYFVDSTGAYCVAASKANEAMTINLAAIAGMSLGKSLGVASTMVSNLPHLVENR